MRQGVKNQWDSLVEIKGRIKDLCKAPSRAVRLFGGHLHMLFFLFFFLKKERLIELWQPASDW